MHPSDVPDEIVQDLCVRTALNARPITFLTIDDLTADERPLVPTLWLDALNQSGREGVRLMLDECDRVLPGRLPRTVARFREACVDLILGRRLGLPVLVYVLEGTFGRRRYSPWTTTPPQPLSAVPDHLRRLSADVLALHTRLHDEIDAPLFGGLLPLEWMELVSDYHEPDRPFEMYPPMAEPDWSQVVVIQNDGGSGRLCAILGDDPSATAGWYWFEGSMSPERDIWVVADDWLVGGASDWS